MSDLTTQQLKDEVYKILKDADLTVISAKKVRLELEGKLNSKLKDRMPEINKFCLEYINSQESEKEEKSEKESESSSSESESEESEPARPRKRAAAPVSKAPAKKRKPAEKKEGGAKKGNGFTRPYTLSPALATLMGAESLPRHEVVKKVWAIIKERNLYDPKNKQFAICDSDLQTVMGVKRFRTFGMLKYLKPHFLD